MEAVLNWLKNNQELLINYAIHFVIAIVIFVVGKFVAKIITKAVEKVMSHRSVDAAVTSFVSSIIYGVLVTVALIAAISHLGFNTSSLVAIIGAAGLAVGLALQGSLSNFASGVLIILFKPFKSGDFVEVAGVSGIVEEILVFSTKCRTPDNKTVIIPNGAITSGTITNYSTKPIRRIDLVIGVGYDADLKKTKEVLMDVASKHPLVLPNEEIMIAVSELADSSVNFVVRPWVKSDDYWPVRFELLENIKIALDENDIEIPFPQLSVHMNKED
ncbi:mechanosensitive ion channel family protein [Thalassotalea agarivorans]|uniref:Small-conductance mechanosensitive channel n=1 Tax=Thalassotalea agarivorans TaxID=349064 RepID=A0A1I0ADT5_THASX|nr:mechanosensitive ion channel domain-containing protein [Thalassotalea agarivorans]SES92417.1 small conductance mechanosensitive channel [Thalassotalea agarivorans]